MTNEGWTAIEISLAAGTTEESAEADLLSAILFELGASGLETRDEAAGLRVIAAFPPAIDRAALPALVAEALEANEIPIAGIDAHGYEPIDWATHWRRHFSPIHFGPPSDPDRLWVVPTWIEPPEAARHVLRIDPSTAFGTGLHATTALCLDRIVELSSTGSALDVGTGTGILALAALALGARRAVATDNDPEALRVAAENAERNQASGLELSDLDPGRLGETFDLVAANILARPLIDLSEELAASLKPGGRLMLSGILTTQAEEVLAAYVARGLTKEGITTREEWARIDLVRSAGG